LKAKTLEAGLPDYCIPNGLRKVVAINLAKLGASEFQLTVVIGWKTRLKSENITKKRSVR
jgi:hypothetical protein